MQTSSQNVYTPLIKNIVNKCFFWSFLCVIFFFVLLLKIAASNAMRIEWKKKNKIQFQFVK